MREFLDEAHRIGDKHAGRGFRPQRPHGGVERREELICHKHLAPRESAHERRLARVGVSDQRDAQLVAARGAPLFVVVLDLVELRLEFGAAVPDLAAVEIDVGFARADAALPAAPRRGLSKAWDDVLQPGHLHLELRLAAARVAVKDLHDHAGPIEHVSAGRPLEVARLARRDLMVDDHDVGRWLRVRPWLGPARKPARRPRRSALALSTSTRSPSCRPRPCRR